VYHQDARPFLFYGVIVGKISLKDRAALTVFHRFRHQSSLCGLRNRHYDKGQQKKLHHTPPKSLFWQILIILPMKYRPILHERQVVYQRIHCALSHPPPSLIQPMIVSIMS
jgi:hypothetical protein